MRNCECTSAVHRAVRQSCKAAPLSTQQAPMFRRCTFQRRQVAHYGAASEPTRHTPHAIALLNVNLLYLYADARVFKPETIHARDLDACAQCASEHGFRGARNARTAWRGCAQQLHRREGFAARFSWPSARARTRSAGQRAKVMRCVPPAVCEVAVTRAARNLILPFRASRVAALRDAELAAPGAPRRPQRAPSRATARSSQHCGGARAVWAQGARGRRRRPGL